MANLITLSAITGCISPASGSTEETIFNSFEIISFYKKESIINFVDIYFVVIVFAKHIQNFQFLSAVDRDNFYDYIVSLGDSTTFSGDVTFNGDVTINGDLMVSGTTTSINTVNLNIADNTILLNSGETGAGVTEGTSGIQIDRGSLTDESFLWSEVLSGWTLNTLTAQTLKAVNANLDTLTSTTIYCNDIYTSGASIHLGDATISYNGSVNINTGLNVQSLSATTISATTFYGNLVSTEELSLTDITGDLANSAVTLDTVYCQYLSNGTSTFIFPSTGGTFTTWNSVPETSGSTGIAGQFAYDSTYLYLCINTNIWIKFTGSTWV